MPRALAGVWMLTLCACPPRATPEHGIQLVYGKPEHAADVRAVVDRRLAQLKVKATLQEDTKTLRMRLTDAADVARVKAVMKVPAKLEFCAEDAKAAKALCEDARATDRIDEACAVRDAKPEAFADAGVRLAVQRGPDGVTGFAVEADCFAPRVVAASFKDGDFPGVMLEFDRASGREFGELTQRLISKRLLILLDGEVQSAPVVREAISGGKAMLSVGALRRDEAESLAAALAGGALPALPLESEAAFGPPSLLGH